MKKKKRVKVDIQLPEDAYASIKAIAKLSGVSKNDVINVILATKVLEMQDDG